MNNFIDPKALPDLAWYGTVVGMLVVVALGVMGGIAFWKGKETAQSFTGLIPIVLQMLTVVLIVI